MKESPLHGPDGAVGGREAGRGAGAAPPRTPDTRATPSRTGSNIASTDLAFGEGEALRVEDVMRILHLSRNTVYKLAREGTLPSFRVGRQMRFRYEDVRARLEGSAAGVQPHLGAPVPEGGRTPAGVPAAQVAAVSHEASCADANPNANPNELVEEMPAWARGSLVVGGQSMVGDVLANYLSGLGVKVLRAHANAYVSLARMYLGSCHAAVVDLWSEADGAYNTPYLRRMLPGVSAVAFRLYKQRVGFTVATHNPRSLLSWTDLLSEGVRVANRERGAGTRVLLDEKLKYLEARADLVAGYDRPVASELAQALMVARGLADVALTSEKPFRQVKGLDFVPLQEEATDLVVLRTPETAPLVKAVRSLLRTDAFRGEFDATLFDTRLMGEVVYEC